MKIIICGACGRMGRMVTEAAIERGDEIVCGVDVSPAPMSYPVFSNFGEVKAATNVVIDFSAPSRLTERLEFCNQRNIGIVLASTGFSQSDNRIIRDYSEKIPVFKSANLSIGINLLCYLVKKAAETLGKDFDIRIVEQHHRQKKDAPSGTALMLAQSAEKGGQNCFIYAIRAGTIVGEHEVTFAGDDEIVTLSHSARSRKIFAVGALNAAKWLTLQPAGQYDMNDMLKDRL